MKILSNKTTMKSRIFLKALVVVSMTLSLNAEQTMNYAELQSFAVQKYMANIK